jgi:sulfur carrier protein
MPDDALKKNTPQIRVIVNGKEEMIPDGTRIGHLAVHYLLAPRMILVERNGAVLHRSEWPDQLIEEGDRIEFIKVVAGG